MSFIQKISRFILDEMLINGKENVLLAVSGGMDSMVMLHVLYRLKIPIAVAHCNFQLRNKDSDLDEALVQKKCDEFGVQFHSMRFETKLYAEKNKLSIQEAARDLRYNWFLNLSEKNNYDKIATAHHFDDSIETVLINLDRGTGLKGLRGILPKRGKIIRPLLLLKKEEIEDFAQEFKIEFRNDQSNFENKYLRNEIRNLVIPKLKERNNKFYQEWRKKIDENCRLWLKLERDIARAKEHCFLSNHKISVSELLKFQNSGDLLFYFLDGFGFSTNQRIEAKKLLKSQSGKSIFGRTHCILRNRDSLIIRQNEQNESVFHKIDISMNKLVSDSFELKFEEMNKHNMEFENNGKVAILNFDRIQFPLTLRNWAHGDTFRPLGMKGMKKLSDFLVDLKLSKFEKEKQLVLCSNEDILWVVGKRISEDFKIENSSQRALRLEWKPKEKYTH